MVKPKYAASRKTYRKAKRGYRKMKNSSKYRMKRYTKKKYPVENQKIHSFHHTMLIRSTYVLNPEAQQDGSDAAAKNYFGSYTSKDQGSPEYTAFLALKGMLVLSPKHFNIDICPLITDMSYSINNTFYQTIKHIIERRHTTVGSSTYGLDPVLAAPIISWSGIKITVIKEEEFMRRYIPCVGLQTSPQGGIDFITFPNGKIYIKFAKGMLSSIGNINIPAQAVQGMLQNQPYVPQQVVQGGSAYASIQQGMWPNQLIIGNCGTVKYKIYYKILNKKYFQQAASGVETRNLFGNAAFIGGDRNNQQLVGYTTHG